MENIKTETLIITILIMYVITAFASTTANVPAWIIGLILAGFCILFFPMIVKYSDKMRDTHFKDNKGLYYLIYYLFFVFLTAFYVLQSIYYGIKTHGEKR